MIVSHNEIINMVSKAFMSIRCQYGEADLIAKMVADLQIAGLDGVRHFNNASKYLLTEDSQPVSIVDELIINNGLLKGFENIDSHNNSNGTKNLESLIITFDLHGNSVAYHLPVILDYATEKLDDFVSVTLELKNCHNRWLAYGELTQLAAKGMSCIARWDNGSDPKHTLCVVNRGFVFPDLYFFTQRILSKDIQDMTIEIAYADFNVDEYIASCQGHLSSKVIVELNDKSWQSGINVDDQEWLTLKQTASRLLVKNSEQSAQDAGGI